MANEGGLNRRLGRGMEALIGGFVSTPKLASEPVTQPAAAAAADAPKDWLQVGVGSIQRNPFQPRVDFNEEALSELADSIKVHGVLQPVLVRRVDDSFQLIAGERRWLAAQRAGLLTVPCRVLDLQDQQVSEAALEENLKRRDLNVLEKAQAFHDYVKRFECSIEDLGKRLSLDRSTVSNMMRLLELPDPIRKLLLEDKITAGHAKAILPLEETHQLGLCARIQSESLTVRETEAAARSIIKGDAPPETISIEVGRKQREQLEITPHVKSLEQQFRDMVGLKVKIKQKTKDSGHVVIEFNSNDDFERLTKFLRKAA